MRGLKDQVIGAGFAFFSATRLHRMVAPLTAGCGVILMLHHVRPFVERDFAPNRLLEITPTFLRSALLHMRALGYDFVSMDEAVNRLQMPKADRRRFAAVTLDDGYLDLAQHALPVFEELEVPFTAYVTSGFADGAERLWWLELEDAVRTLDHIAPGLCGNSTAIAARTPGEKKAAYHQTYWHLRNLPEGEMRDAIAHLAHSAKQTTGTHSKRLCCGWADIRRLARNPLCTIGAHTVSHPMLAKHERAIAFHEMAESRRRIEEAIGLPVRHFAYPVGDPTSAGPREFALATECGFSSAVTTRPGLLFPQHRDALTALPRLSLNGNWQSLDNLDILLSGVPFALWNGRRAA